MADAVWAVLVGICMLIGLIGTLLPAVPDLALIWAAALGYGLLAGWGPWGPWLFAGISLLCGGGVLAEVLTSSAGARAGGASGWSIAGGIVAGVLLLVIAGPLGGLIALLAGIFLLEWRKHRDGRRAGKAVLGTAIGYSASFFIKFAMGFGAVGLWVIWLITRALA
jgi:uncharacterized protein YqgC (DUF456 family)